MRLGHKHRAVTRQVSNRRLGRLVATKTSTQAGVSAGSRHPGLCTSSRRTYTPPSPSLGAPLLSPSASPPSCCGMPPIAGGGCGAVTGGGGACGTNVGEGTTGGATVGGGGGAGRGVTVAVGAGGGVAVGAGRGATVGAGRDVAVGDGAGRVATVGATRCAACVVEALVCAATAPPIPANAMRDTVINTAMRSLMGVPAF